MNVILTRQLMLMRITIMSILDAENIQKNTRYF
jgi:hypothetical protein